VTPTSPDRTLAALHRLLDAVRAGNPFYAEKLRGLPARFASLADFQAQVPFTSRAEWTADQLAHPPFGRNLSEPPERYTRFCQTSGTSGRPMCWLDTAESWDWMLGNWARILAACGFTAADRLFFAFSFGPFLGFWTAFEACARLGALVIPGGGLGTSARLRVLRENRVTGMFCTPTYALHLAQAARAEGMDPASFGLRRLLVAGEPGGSVPEIRAALEAAWPGAQVLDHHGMTEVGPVTYPCPAVPGVLRVLEDRYFAEVADLRPDGTGELVLTPLGRAASPLLRYRTGDLVRPRREPGRELGLEGGILGRVDDMVIIRGVNVYPAAVEAVVRQFPAAGEFVVEVHRDGVLPRLELRVEALDGDPARLCAALERRLHDWLSLRVPVHPAPSGTLPRSEFKSRRWRWLPAPDAPTSPPPPNAS
jgi:phenylacetate-CoA ligase